MQEKQGIVDYINGPVIKAENMQGFKMREMVTVGSKRLIGEVISLDGYNGTVQVYEETSGLKVGEEITSTGKPLSVKLGPGIIGNIFDGIQRPLGLIFDKSGSFIDEGIGLLSIDLTKVWMVTLQVEEG